MTTLRCEDLHRSFDGVRALAGVSVKFCGPAIVAVIGPNGAGKTTLINILTGALPLDSGRCLLDDSDITSLPTHRIAQLGIVRTFQDLRLVFQVSVLDNVLLARPHQHGEAFVGALLRLGVSAEETFNRDVAMRLLKSVGLDEKAGCLAGELSYGQQKLLTLACCLATEPRVLLLDEPVAGVHPEMIMGILGILRQLRDDGKLIVLVEHDIAVVRQVADTVVVMDEGKVIAEGTPRDVLKRPEIMEAYLA